MTDSDRTDDGRPTRALARSLRVAATTVGRVLVDAVILTLWVAFLALFFLQTAWPRWAFYASLILGVGVYVAVTAPWTRRRGE